MDVHPSIPSSNEATLLDTAYLVWLPQSSSAHHSFVENSAVVPYSSLVMHELAFPWSRLPGADQPWSIGLLLNYSCMEFTRITLMRNMLHELIGDKLSALCSSTARQHQSYWRSFQEFLRSRSVVYIGLQLLRLSCIPLSHLGMLSDDCHLPLCGC